MKNIIKTALLAALLASVIPATSHAAKQPQQTFRRKSDPVIITGAQLKKLDGAKIATMRVYTSIGGKLAAVPYQVDERLPDGSYAFTSGKHRTEDTDQGRLDANDELVIMARDLGRRASRASLDRLRATARVEIAATDPLSGARAWAYVLTFKTPPRRSPRDYVTVSAAGNAISTPNYFVGFDPAIPIGFNRLGLTRAGGGDGRNTVDCLKIRATVSVKMANVDIQKTEADFTSELIAYIDGPVRAIRRTSNAMNLFWKFSTPSSIIDNIYYYDSFEFPTEVNVPFDVSAVLRDFRFRVSTDGNEAQRGKLFVNSNNRTPSVIDGVMSDAEKKLDLAPYNWSVIYGKGAAPGGWLNTLEFDKGLQVVPALYYVDDARATEEPENSPGQIGAAGYNLENLHTLKRGVWRLVSIMYNVPHYRPGAENEFINIRRHPLKVTVK